MKHVKGGIECGCACYYADTGGSSVDDNCDKNHEKGLWSPRGNIKCMNVAEL